MSELSSKPDQELFTYTSGRYLYNEKLRLAERCVRFNVLALKHIAATSVGRRSNAVGSEYIILEKAPGQPLESRWFSLTPKERVRLVTSFVEIERKMFSFPLGSYGSLY